MIKTAMIYAMTDKCLDVVFSKISLAFRTNAPHIRLGTFKEISFSSLDGSDYRIHEGRVVKNVPGLVVDAKHMEVLFHYDSNSNINGIIKSLTHMLSEDMGFNFLDFDVDTYSEYSIQVMIRNLDNQKIMDICEIKNLKIK